MSDRTVKVTLTANVDSYTAALKKATNTALSFNKTQQDLAAKAKQLTQQAEQAARADESQLQKLQRQAAEARKTSEEYNNAYQKMATGLTAIGGAMAGLAVGGMAAAVKGFTEFDAQMSNVAASTGATGTQLDQLRQAAMDAGAEFGQFTSTDAAGALEELGKAGLDTTQSIEALRGVMGLAAADNMEVGRAAEVTAQALTMFSREGVTATQVADALAQGAGAAVGSASELAEGLGNVGPVAASMGITMRDTVQTLALFAQNGIRGAEGGTQLKSMLLQLQNPTEQASKAMQQLGISAYDANGNFVGMRTIFAQLAKGAKNMSAEQRDAALATVFGSHAVLSANIAMREGVEGYDAMNEAMAEFGSAADMAAKRTDNLAGDWKNFTGVMENVAIKMGEAANGPLRKLVQQLTDMAEWAQRNTGTVQVLLGITGALGGLALTAGGVMKATKTIAEFKESLTALGMMSKLTTATGGFKTFFTDIAGMAKNGGVALGEFKAAAKDIGLINASKQTGGVKGFFSAVTSGASGATKAVLGFSAVSVAIAGVTAAITAMSDAAEKAYEKTMVKSDDWKVAMTDGANEIQKTIDGISFRKNTYYGPLVMPQYEDLDLGAAIEHINNNGFLTGVGEVWNSNYGLTNNIKKTVDEIDDALSSMPFENAYEGFRLIQANAEKSNVSFDELANNFPKYSQRLHDYAEQQGFTNISTEEFTKWMGGELPAAIAESQRQMGLLKNGVNGTGQSVLDFTSSVEGSAAALQQQSDATKEALNDLTAYSNAAIASSNSAIAVREAIQGVTDSVKENGKSVDIYTEAGQANTRALNQLAAAHNSMLQSMQQAGATAKQIEAAQAGMRAEFKQTTKSLGLVGDAIEEMTDEYYKTPENIETTISVIGASMATSEVEKFVKGAGKVPDSILTEVGVKGYQGSAAELDSLRKKIMDLPTDKQVSLIATFQVGGMDAVDKAIAEINAKKAQVNVVFSMSGVSAVKATSRMIASAQADGSVLSFYARGGVSERHIAQMAPAGAWRVWAEPETGGEAYIPLAASKRARSEAILAEVARRFGMRLEKYATGGISIPNITMPAPRTITATRPSTPRTNYTPTSSPVIVETSSPTDVATAVKQALTGLTWIMDGKAIDVRLAEREQTAGLAMQWRGI